MEDKTILAKVVDLLSNREVPQEVETPETPETNDTIDVVEEVEVEVSEDVETIEEVETTAEETPEVTTEETNEETPIEEVVTTNKLDRYETSKKLMQIGITDGEVMDGFIEILESNDTSKIIDLIGELTKPRKGVATLVSEEVTEDKKPRQKRII
jgi:hypothetical protein